MVGLSRQLLRNQPPMSVLKKHEQLELNQLPSCDFPCIITMISKHGIFREKDDTVSKNRESLVDSLYFCQENAISH